MDTTSFSIFEFSIIVFLMVGALLFVFFRLFKYMMQFIRLPLQKVEFLNKYLPVVELITWIIFLLWSVQYLSSRGQLISLLPLLVFIIIILYLAWYTLKDITAGVIFKTGKTHHVDDHISVAGITGKITAMGMRNLQIEDYSGQIVTIPYSKIVGNIMLKSYPSQSLLSHNFRIKIATDKNTDIFRTIENMRTSILTLPWSSQKKEPKITIEEEANQSYTLSITIFSLDESYFKKTEKILQQQFNGIII
ncbi:MAG: mechanosensitive ion channel family protein [Bacteroidales bacterium]|nr:mechanosensitive ion channel family protein [Bacteroidales bacterium]